MKKFIKSIPVFLTVAMILCCSVFVPALAVSDGVLLYEKHSDEFFFDGTFIGYEGAFCSAYLLPVGVYDIEFIAICGASFEHNNMIYDDSSVPSVWISHPDLSGFYLLNNPVSFKLTVTEDMVCTDFNDEYEIFNGYCVLYVNSFESEPSVSVAIAEKQSGVYYQAFNMFADFFYGDGAELTGEQNMVLTILATTAVLFVVVVPFLIVFFVLRLFR